MLISHTLAVLYIAVATWAFGVVSAGDFVGSQWIWNGPPGADGIT
jgi:hypothetical protein